MDVCVRGIGCLMMLIMKVLEKGRSSGWGHLFLVSDRLEPRREEQTERQKEEEPRPQRG